MGLADPSKPVQLLTAHFPGLLRGWAVWQAAQGADLQAVVCENWAVYQYWSIVNPDMRWRVRGIVSIRPM